MCQILATIAMFAKVDLPPTGRPYYIAWRRAMSFHRLMRLRHLPFQTLWVAVTCSVLQAGAPLPVLTRSDVVFMYDASPDVYRDYGATFLAWGGGSRERSTPPGVKVFGSVGMVTEFSRYYERFPDRYEAGLCRGLDGKPFKVPWLTDHQHKGVPYYWCCTRQPVFRQYISERVVETVKRGVDGVHIDDHLGTSGALFVDGGCFCEACKVQFREDLKKHPQAGVSDAESYDFPSEARKFISEKPGRRVQEHPLWPAWRSYQLRGAAAFMTELRQLAARTAGKPVPMSANACILWGPHLNDYSALDFFSAEIEHHAPTRTFTDDPVAAYRMADEVGRPLASTASGGDWAYIKENNLPGLVQTWVALGYACGNMLMAPHRQWCYTKEKGTHWYAGPREKFAPLYRFVHDNPGLFDGYENLADVSVAYAQPTFDRDSGRLLGICRKLSQAHIAYELLLGGDDVVVHRLDPGKVAKARRLFIVDERDFTPEDAAQLARIDASRRVKSLDELLAGAKPTVSVTGAAGSSKIRIFPRTKPGSAVIHVLNADYRTEQDTVSPIENLRLRLDLEQLGMPGTKAVQAWTPGSATKSATLPVQADGSVTIPKAGLWTVLELK